MKLNTKTEAKNPQSQPQSSKNLILYKSCKANYAYETLKFNTLFPVIISTLLFNIYFLFSSK